MSLSPDTTHSSEAESESPAFAVSTAPLIPERNGNHGKTDSAALGLPRSYGLETLWLMARDPQSLFAYWDIDWTAVFAEENPKPRKVQLRILDEDDSEQASLEVEPMAGQCQVNVTQADTAYRAEIGFHDPAGEWTVVSRSETVFVPPDREGVIEPGDFVTVPLHLSFQRMLEATRSLAGENDSLVETLARLQQRAGPAEESGAFTDSQRAVLRSIDEAAARSPAPEKRGAPDLWEQHKLEKIFGSGNSSLHGGFGGSSRG